MTKTIHVMLEGCDDSTQFLMDIPKDSMRFFEAFTKAIAETSDYSCMPKLIWSEQLPTDPDEYPSFDEDGNKK